MRTRRLPGSTLDLSVVGFGCWAIGKQYWGDDVTDDVSTAAIHAAIEGGINWFDTAPLYGEGHADSVLVKALGPKKHDLVIATKVGVRLGGEGEHASSDLHPDWIIEDTNSSLERLGLETIDLLQVHWPCDHGSQLDDTIATLDALCTAGKIRYFGLCNYDAAAVSSTASHPKLVSTQTPYSLLRREFETGLFKAVSGKNPVGVLAYEPLCRGLLSGKFKVMPQFPDSDMRSWDERFQGPRFHHAKRLVADLDQVAQRIGVPTAAIAIAWVVAQPGVTAAIVGAKRPEQVVQNVQAAAIASRPNVIAVVDKIAAIHGGW
jgi:aryl-alcohol dehydrogenase-like predicted oxidoreductase